MLAIHIVNVDYIQSYVNILTIISNNYIKLNIFGKN